MKISFEHLLIKNQRMSNTKILISRKAICRSNLTDNFTGLTASSNMKILSIRHRQIERISTILVCSQRISINQSIKSVGNNSTLHERQAIRLIIKTINNKRTELLIKGITAMLNTSIGRTRAKDISIQIIFNVCLALLVMNMLIENQLILKDSIKSHRFCAFPRRQQISNGTHLRLIYNQFAVITDRVQLTIHVHHFILFFSN